VLGQEVHKTGKNKMKSSGFMKRFDAFKLKASLNWTATLMGEYNQLLQENTVI
jgi:hypothetical protein